MEISAREQKVYDIFEEIGIEYQLYRHEAIYTIAAAEELDKKLEVPIAKNLFLSTKHGTEYYMLTLMGHKKFNTGKISKQIGVPRMTFAGEEKMIDALRAINDFGARFLPADAFDALCATPQGIQGLYRMMQSMEPDVKTEKNSSENLSDSDLRRMMRDPKYWRDAEPEYVRKIENGFKKLYS